MEDTQDDFLVWRKIFLQLMPKDLFSSNTVQRNMCIICCVGCSYKPQSIRVLDTLVRIFTHLLSARATVLIIVNIELADEKSLKLLME